MNATSLFALDKFINEELTSIGLVGGHMVYSSDPEDDTDIFEVLIGDEVLVTSQGHTIEVTKFSQVVKLYEAWRNS